MRSEIEIKNILTSFFPDGNYLKKAQYDKFPLIKDNVFNAKDLNQDFLSMPEESLKKYSGTRIQISGIAIKVEIDIHGLPSVQVSDTLNGEIYILCVFNDNSILKEVERGNKVVIEGNYLVYHKDYRIVLKNCELIKKDI
jgi:hypothetical protein